MAVLTDFLTEIADAIRDKTGSTGEILASDFATRIVSIETGGTSIETCNVSITSSGLSINRFIYSQLIGGVITPIHEYFNSSNYAYDISNAICNTIIEIDTGYVTTTPNVTITGDATLFATIIALNSRRFIFTGNSSGDIAIEISAS